MLFRSEGGAGWGIKRFATDLLDDVQPNWDLYIDDKYVGKAGNTLLPSGKHVISAVDPFTGQRISIVYDNTTSSVRNRASVPNTAQVTPRVLTVPPGTYGSVTRRVWE